MCAGLPSKEKGQAALCLPVGCCKVDWKGPVTGKEDVPPRAAFTRRGSGRPRRLACKGEEKEASCEEGSLLLSAHVPSPKTVMKESEPQTRSEDSAGRNERSPSGRPAPRGERNAQNAQPAIRRRLALPRGSVSACLTPIPLNESCAGPELGENRPLTLSLATRSAPSSLISHQICFHPRQTGKISRSAAAGTIQEQRLETAWLMLKQGTGPAQLGQWVGGEALLPEI